MRNSNNATKKIFEILFQRFFVFFFSSCIRSTFRFEIQAKMHKENNGNFFLSIRRMGERVMMLANRTRKLNNKLQRLCDFFFLISLNNWIFFCGKMQCKQEKMCLDFERMFENSFVLTSSCRTPL